MQELIKSEIFLISGGECVFEGAFNSTYSDVWPIGYGPLSPDCQEEYILIEERPDKMPPKTPHKQPPSLFGIIVFVSSLVVGYLVTSVISIYITTSISIKKRK